MNTHRFLQYLKYRGKAKGRHGTHSPFVYAFIEDCINKNREQPLLARIKQYFNDWQIITLGEHPSQWQLAINNTGSRTLFIVPDIHKNADNTKAWTALSQLRHINYSADLFDFGLLFIHEDFKEKQHFILKK